MDLLIDIGNTRVKWTCLHDGELAPIQSHEHKEWVSNDFERVVLDALTVAPKQIVVSNVAGQSLATVVRDACAARGLHDPQFLVSPKSAFGIVNGYRDPSKLGVDRWLGIVAAYRMTRAACVVVNIGTAATIDGVLHDGRHLGGLILPGPTLMEKSLLSNTADLAERAASGNEGLGLFADNTKAAIVQGANQAIAATVERAVAAMHEQHGVQPQIVLTGGAHVRISPLLAIKHSVIPDLVLRGLAEYAQYPEHAN